MRTQLPTVPSGSSNGSGGGGAGGGGRRAGRTQPPRVQLGGKYFLHTLTGEYAARVQSWDAYDRVSLDILHRCVYEGEGACVCVGGGGGAVCGS
jgi:hypothetical protein